MRKLCALVALVGGLLPTGLAMAQDPAPGAPAAPAEGQPTGEGPKAEEPKAEEPKAEEKKEEAKPAEEAKPSEEAKPAKKDEDEVPVSDAKEEGDGELKPLPPISSERLSEAGVKQSYPYVEHHGMFRVRADAFGNLDFNTTGTSPIAPPPAAFPIDGSDDGYVPDPEADWYAGANIRFRYTPKLHIYEDLSVTIQVDVPDNMVLGSFPDGPEGSRQRAEVPTLAFSGTQTPPSGRFGLQLKQAYGEVKPFFGVVRAGRMASQWGLGILANGGQCADCDYGDFNDRIMLLTKAFGFYVVGAYDFPAEGPLNYDGLNDGLNPFGQPRDGGEFDDVSQYILSVFKRPITDKDKAEQTRILKDEGRPVVNGGFYLVYREQEASYEGYERLDTYGSDPNDLPVLQARGAEAWIPDLWVQMLWEPQFRSKLRLELEVTGIYGSIDFVSEPGAGASECFSDPSQAGCNDRARDVRQLGVAFEGEYQHNQFLTVGLYSGFATGRKNFGFQVNDGQLDPLDDPSNFRFDRDYIVDMILFREIIGTVTNAMYIKPWSQFDFRPNNDRDSLGLRVEGIYSRAVEPESTPSGEANLGLEFDALLYYREEGKFQADIGYGLLLPLAAFDEKIGRPRLDYPGSLGEGQTFTADTGSPRKADVAQTVQARMFWFF